MHTFLGLLVLSLALAVCASPLGSRIVGGADAPAGKYPYQVSLWRTGRKFSCGGSIINERYILTAAHCIAGLRPRQISVGIGSQLLNETVNFYDAERLIWHDGFDSMNVANDIGLIRLTEKIVYTDEVKPIPLTTENFSLENYPVALSGWGRLWRGGPQPNSLQEIELRIVDQKACEADLYVSSTQICTLTKTGEGACNGDSGGPLVVDGVQIGIVSFGVPCARGVPDVYTRVHSYLDWIAENVYLE